MPQPPNRETILRLCPNLNVYARPRMDDKRGNRVDMIWLSRNGSSPIIRFDESSHAYSLLLGVYEGILRESPFIPLYSELITLLNYNYCSLNERDIVIAQQLNFCLVSDKIREMQWIFSKDRRYDFEPT